MKKFLLLIPMLLLGACSVQFGGDSAKETLPPLTNSNTTIHEFEPSPTQPSDYSSDEKNDLFLSLYEYQLFYQTMDAMGYVNIIDRTAAQSVGEGACTVASLSTSQDEFTTMLAQSAIDSGVDGELVGNVIGALGGLMCNDDFTRLGFGS